MLYRLFQLLVTYGPNKLDLYRSYRLTRHGILFVPLTKEGWVF
jgi:hypothetical protein